MSAIAANPAPAMNGWGTTIKEGAQAVLKWALEKIHQLAAFLKQLPSWAIKNPGTATGVVVTVLLVGAIIHSLSKTDDKKART